MADARWCHRRLVGPLGLLPFEPDCMAAFVTSVRWRGSGEPRCFEERTHPLTTLPCPTSGAVCVLNSIRIG
jgi:hypothetical protein